MKGINKTFVLYFLPAISIICLMGCAGFVRSNVAVFHQLAENPIPTTYIFVPLKGQEISLEYKTYQELVRQQLSKNQYREVTPEETHDVVIAFSYGIDSGKEKLDSIPIFGATGISSSTTYGTLSNYGTYSGTTTYTPTYGIMGSSMVSSTEYSRGLWLYIVDAKSVGHGAEKLNIMYEGSVKSSGSSSQLLRVMPAMIKALFKKFPGKNGATRTETIAAW